MLRMARYAEAAYYDEPKRSNQGTSLGQRELFYSERCATQFILGPDLISWHEAWAAGHSASGHDVSLSALMLSLGVQTWKLSSSTGACNERIGIWDNAFGYIALDEATNQIVWALGLELTYQLLSRVVLLQEPEQLTQRCLL